MALPSYLGVGLYAVPEAARIIRVRPTTLRSWVHGYTYQTRSGLKSQRPVVPRHLGRTEEPLTFLELIELLFVRLFRNEGVSMQTIRRAATAARQLLQADYPFAIKRFDTDGKRIFGTLEQEARERNEPPRTIEELGRGQTLFEPVIRPFFRHIDFLEPFGLAKRFWPPEGNRRIVLDPERAFGRPIDAETGVPAEALFEAFMATGRRSFREVAGWYRVPVSAVEAAVRFERGLRPAA